MYLLFFMARDVMILMQANPFRGPLKGAGPEMTTRDWLKSVQNYQLLKKTQVYSWRASSRNAKTKVETASLRNLKIMPRNLNEIELSWISSQTSEYSAFGFSPYRTE